MSRSRCIHHRHVLGPACASPDSQRSTAKNVTFELGMREEWFLDHSLLLDLAGVCRACILLEFGIMGAKYVTGLGKKTYSSAGCPPPKKQAFACPRSVNSPGLAGRNICKPNSHPNSTESRKNQMCERNDFELRTSNWACAYPTKNRSCLHTMCPHPLLSLYYYLKILLSLINSYLYIKTSLPEYWI